MEENSNSTNDVINLGKFRMIMRTIEQIMSFQKTSYNFYTPKQNVQSLILDSEKLDSNAQYTESLKCEASNRKNTMVEPINLPLSRNNSTGSTSPPSTAATERKKRVRRNMSSSPKFNLENASDSDSDDDQDNCNNNNNIIPLFHVRSNWSPRLRQHTTSTVLLTTYHEKLRNQSQV